MKIKIIILFVALNSLYFTQKQTSKPTNKSESANNKIVSLSTLDSISRHNNASMYKWSPKKNSKKIHAFLKLLETQKSLHKSKSIKTIVDLQVKSMLDLMLVGFEINKSLDSVNYYQNKIKTLTTKPKLIGMSYGIRSYLQHQNLLYIEAINGYEIAVKLYRSSKEKKTQYKTIKTLVNINFLYDELGSVKHKKEIVDELAQTIKALPKHPRYENLLQLIKIEKSNNLVSLGLYKSALNLLKSVDTTKLDILPLLEKYFETYHETYKGLGKYKLGELYLDKIHNPKNIDEATIEFLSNDFYIEKLKYALLSKNSKKADFYFKKLKEQTSTIKNFNNQKAYEAYNLYYSSKNDIEKAYYYFKKASEIKNSSKKKIAIERLFNADILKEKELISKKNSHISNLNLLKNIFVAIFLFLTAFIVFFYFKIYKLKKEKINLINNPTFLNKDLAYFENISNKIKTPITSIMGYLNLMKEHPLDHVKRKKYLNKAYDNVEKMNSSLDNFLNIVNSDKSQITIKVKREIKFNSFVREIVSSYQLNLEVKKIAFYYKTDVLDSLKINFEADSLKIILDTLISNAIKYSATSTSIYLSIQFSEQQISICLKDEGYGISEHERDNVFLQFYKTKDNKSTSGYGIGLPLISKVVEKLNGKIRLESKLNVGSVFNIDIPLELKTNSLFKKNETIAFELLSKKNSLETHVNNSFPNLLIVEDNIEIILYLKEVFSNFLNCTIAVNGKEALKFIKENTFNLIISELKLPIMNGAELKAAINKIDTHKKVPFIMIASTTYDLSGDFKKKLGIEEYIQKPFSKDEIVSRVQNILERSITLEKIMSNDTKIDFEGSHDDLMVKIKKTVMLNLTNSDFNVSKLAKISGYEKKKLGQILKSKFGLSLINIILEIRLQTAYDYIVKNKYPTLNEVIYAVGINSRTYFNKKFQEKFGLKAGELKRRHSLK